MAPADVSLSVCLCLSVRLWDDMCTFFDGCSGTVCALGGEGREANATTALLLANARS